MFYSSLENPETRMFAIQDPKGFLQQYANGGIIDEAQLVPELFSYIQGIVDESGKTGQFILSGSQSFLLHDRISQSLAGRTAIFRLLPFSFRELSQADQLLPSYEANIFQGFFPRIYDKRQVMSCSCFNRTIIISINVLSNDLNSIFLIPDCAVLFSELKI
jgi:uncharacterized protein